MQVKPSRPEYKGYYQALNSFRVAGKRIEKGSVLNADQFGSTSRTVFSELAIAGHISEISDAVAKKLEADKKKLAAAKAKAESEASQPQAEN